MQSGVPAPSHDASQHPVARSRRGPRCSCVVLVVSLVLTGLATTGCGTTSQATDTPAPAVMVHSARATVRRATKTRRPDACRARDRTLDALAAALTRTGSGVPGHELVAERPEAAGLVPVGVQAGLRSRTGRDLGDVLMRMTRAHLSYAREDFTWATIEPRRGVFCWAQTDYWMYGVARAGVRVIAVPDASPRWVEATPTTAPTDPMGAREYAAFVRELLGRYGSYGSFWNDHPTLHPDPIRLVDVWNEPYSPQFWARGFPDPAGYAAMFETVVHVSRSTDTRARYLLEADTSSLTPTGQRPFLADALAARPQIERDAYALSVHPYTSNGWGPSVCSTGAERRFQVCRLRELRGILDSHGARRIKLFITELGWSTAGANPSGVAPGVASRYVHELFALLRGRWRGLVDGLVWYEYQSSERDSRQVNDFYGAVQSDGVPGPVWTALAQESSRGIPSGP